MFAMNPEWSLYYQENNYQIPQPNRQIMYFPGSYEFNYYGSQIQPATQGENSQNLDSSELLASEAGAQDHPSKTSNGNNKGKGKGPAKRDSNSYDTMDQDETKFLVNLWTANHERLESKDARKQWSKIVDDLNSQFNNNRSVDKCKRKMKYLVDKYKERKDWNRKQTGGNLWKSPFYDEIDSVLGTRDAVTFQNVEQVVQADSPQSVASTSSNTGNSEDSPSSNENGTTKRRERKKRRRTKEEDDEDTGIKLMNSVAEQGDKITEVIIKMQEAQAKQMDMMVQFMGAMTKAMESSSK